MLRVSEDPVLRMILENGRRICSCTLFYTIQAPPCAPHCVQSLFLPNQPLQTSKWDGLPPWYLRGIGNRTILYLNGKLFSCLPTLVTSGRLSSNNPAAALPNHVSDSLGLECGLDPMTSHEPGKNQNIWLTRTPRMSRQYRFDGRCTYVGQ